MIDFSKLEKALNQLKIALDSTPKSELELDGTIKRFEYSFELTWKFAKKVLKLQGLDENSPKAVLRKMGQLGWLESVELWLELQETRNLTSHEYSEVYTEKAFKNAPLFFGKLQNCLNV